MWDEFAPFYLEISKGALYEGDEAQQTATRRVLVHLQDVLSAAAASLHAVHDGGGLALYTA